MFELFNLGKYKIIIVVGLFLISVISWRFYDYTRTIEKQAKIIETLQKQIVVAQVDLDTERTNVKLITEVVDEQHKVIDKLKARNQHIEQKYNDFKKKSDKEKYELESTLALMQSDLWNNPSCEAGRQLNQMISKLNYDDL